MNEEIPKMILEKVITKLLSCNNIMIETRETSHPLTQDVIDALEQPAPDWEMTEHVAYLRKITSGE